MEMMLMAADYLAARARQLGRAVFRNDAGALTIEWIVIAGLLVAGALFAYPLFKRAITGQAGKMNK